MDGGCGAVVEEYDDIDKLQVDIDNFNVARAAFISRSVIIDYKRALGYSSSSGKEITSEVTSSTIRGARSDTIFGWSLGSRFRPG